MEKSLSRIDVYQTGQNIRRLMLERNMTVKELQLYLQLSAPQSIYHWFEGRSLPTVDNLYALSELFDVPMDMLVCGNKKKGCYFRNVIYYPRFVSYYEKYMELHCDTV